MRTRLAPPLLALLTLACAAPPAITGDVLVEDRASPLVEDTYRILVRLPPGYEGSDARYPVVYQLDATNFGPQFEIEAAHASELARTGAAPEAIVVGVGYPYSIGEFERNRWRDYSTARGAERFLSYLRDELIPYIDATYRTDPSLGRTLSGHSLGGFFALYALLVTGAEAEPPFSNFVAADPSLGEDDARLFALEAELSERTQALPGRRLYLPIARYNGATQLLYFDELRGRLRAYEGLALRAEVVETDHGGLLELGLEEGLRFSLGVNP